MKNLKFYISSVLLSGVFSMGVFAQNSSNTHVVGEVSTIKQSFNQRSVTRKIALGKSKTFELTHISKKSDNVIAKLKNHPASMVTFNYTKTGINGMAVLSPKAKTGYKLYTEKGKLISEEVSTEELMCINYITKNHTESHTPRKGSSSETLSVPEYNSLPSSSKVIYLDFDGEDVYNTSWNTSANKDTIKAQASTFSNTQIQETWSIIAEDYATFDVNVTTDRSVYEATPITKRMKIVFTTTDDGYENAGGVAWIGSFDWNHTDICWVFVDNLSFDAKFAAEAGSHEAGHTFDLLHDNTSTQNYYRGHNNWGPIMGVAYRRPVSQFSKGAYNDAQNHQDDIAIIAGHVGALSDDIPNNHENAQELVLTQNGSDGYIIPDNNQGLINDKNDIDVFKIKAGTGMLNISVFPTASVKTNLDVEITLYDENFTAITTAGTGHENLLSGATLSHNTTAGVYYLSVDGVGTGDPVTGYNDYNSAGPYKISGIAKNAFAEKTDVAAQSLYFNNNDGCGDKNVTPEVSIQNLGYETLTSLDIQIYVNNTLQYTQSQTLSVNQYDSVSISLPEITVSSGNNDVKVELLLPNNSNDANTGDNSITQSVNITNGRLFEFKIKDDVTNSGMNWTIKEGGNQLYDESSVTASTANGYKTQGFCLEEDKCYDFILTDAFIANDGSNCTGVEDWVSSEIYNTGDSLTYDNTLYTATIDIWGARPDLYSHYYNNLGTCGSGSNFDETDYFQLTDLKENEIIAKVNASTYTSPYTKNFCIEGPSATYDIALTKLISNNALNCGVSEITPYVEFKNKGSETVNTIALDVYLNDNFIRTENYTPNLVAGGEINYELSAVALNQNGINTLKVEVRMTSNTESITDNNQGTYNFEYTAGQNVLFQIKEDVLNSAMNWSILNNGDTLATNSNVAVHSENGYREQPFCLHEEDSCSNLVVSDAFITGSGNGNCDGIEGWDADKIYYDGDQVVYNSKKYEANYWTQNHNPEVHEGQWDEWKYIEDCSSGNAPNFDETDFFKLVDLETNTTLTKVLASEYTSPSTSEFCFTSNQKDAINNTENTMKLQNFKVYPNPVSQTLYFSETADAVKVYSIAGEVLRTGNNQSNIDFSGLASGYYIVQIEKDGKTKTFKIIK